MVWYSGGGGGYCGGRGVCGCVDVGRCDGGGGFNSWWVCGMGRGVLLLMVMGVVENVKIWRDVERR